MSNQPLTAAFSHHAFLRGLSERHLMMLASGVRPLTLRLGELLAHEGQPAKALYLIQTGHVAIETYRPAGGAVRVQTVGPGEVVGWSWIVEPYRWQFDARAMDAVTALALDAEWLRERCASDHELGYCLLKELVAVIAARLSATRLQLLDVYK